jgi:2-iminobutanoate/2-iminopropanoate deaminase
MRKRYGVPYGEKMKTVIKTDKAPAPVGPYSQAIRTGNLLFCSGQVSINPKDNQVVLGDIKDQTKLVLENIKNVLAEGGASLDNVVKTTIFLKRMSDFAQVNEVYAGYFTNEPPARSTIEVSALPKGVDVEIEVIAAI